MTPEQPIGKITTSEPYAYGDELTYKIGAEWLQDCRTIHDWGCGRGYFRHFMTKLMAEKMVNHPPAITGVDMGVDSVPQDNPFADIRANLAEYHPDPQPEGIFMRHVLEHNFNWEAILRNALNHCTRKLYVAIYTPLHISDENDEKNDDKVLQLNGPPLYDPPVPNLSLSHRKLKRLLDEYEAKYPDLSYTLQEVAVHHSYQKDVILMVNKNGV